jgi:gluconolactonase
MELKQTLKLLMGLVVLCMLSKCAPKDSEQKSNFSSTDLQDAQMRIEVFDTSALTLLDPNSGIEILGEGFLWSEGPLWVDTLKALLFSDVPVNTIFQWKEEEGVSVYLESSGHSGPENTTSGFGSNGLLLDHQGHLVVCQHGDRRVARMDAPLVAPTSEWKSLADTIKGVPFNSPNDLDMDSLGRLYFTDPPYGRPEQKTGEIGYNGVFMRDTTGEVTTLLDSLSKPNGIALSPDEKWLYINQSDPFAPQLYRYEIKEDGSLNNGGLFFDFTAASKKHIGSADGLKVHSSGIVFATGPGGVHLIDPNGKHLAIIQTGKATSNCAFDRNERHLYMTSTDRILRLPLHPALPPQQ